MRNFSVRSGCEANSSINKGFLKMQNPTVAVVTCSGCELMPFASFIDRQEKSRVGWNNGFFKIVIDPFLPRQTPNSVLLEEVTKNLHTVVVQRLIQCTAENIYQCKFSPASAQTTEKFKRTSLASFTEDTCCSQAVKLGEDLLAHFFNDLQKSSASFSKDSTSYEEKKEHLLREGTRLRQLYEDSRLESDNNLISSTTSKCQCPDCGPASALRLSSSSKNNIVYGSGVVLQNTDPILITGGFSLSTIKNILDIGDYYEGLSCSYFYVGTKNSFFPLHLEDANLWSINYLHFGLPKIWIIIPPRATLLLNYHLSKSGLALGNTSCLNILGHKTVFPSTKWLEERLIPFEVVVQNPGEAIVLYPGSPHYGFNSGWNLAEAINFGTISWIPEGINAPKCQCIHRQVHLDMSIFVAAFRPDLLDKYLARKYIETERHLNSITFFHESIKKLIQMGNQTITEPQPDSKRRQKVKQVNQEDLVLECPAPFCNSKYTVKQSGSLFKHIVNNHRPIVQKCNLLNKLEDQLKRVKKQ